MYYTINPKEKTVIIGDDTTIFDSLYEMSHYSSLDYGRTTIYYWDLDEDKELWKLEMPPLAKGFPIRYVKFYGKCIVTGDMLCSMDGNNTKFLKPSMSIDEIKKIVKFNDVE